MALGLRWSHFTALVIVAAVGGWMATGDLVIGGQGDRGEKKSAVPATRNGRAGDEPFRVRVETFSATPRAAELEIRGRTEAEARIAVRAETTGLVAERPVSEGARVRRGDLLCRIEAGAREAKVLHARAQLAQAELDFEAASTLSKKGFTAETRLRALKAAHDAALAAVKEAEVERDRTRILSPSDGVIEEPLIERGEMLAAGGVCATVLNDDPMIVTGQVSERDVGRLALGMTARINLVDGQTAEGRIRFISRSSDAKTRTFRVEVEIANADGRLRAGITASAFVALTPTPAHLIPSSILVLADDGTVGIRAVDESGLVAFLPVTLLGDAVDSGTRGIWVAGLPDRVTAITVGQDYVRAGEHVEPVEASASSEPARES